MNIRPEFSDRTGRAHCMRYLPQNAEYYCRQPRMSEGFLHRTCSLEKKGTGRWV